MSHSVETRWRYAKDQGLHYKRFSLSPARHGTTNQGLTTAGGSGNGEKRWLSIANSESWARSACEKTSALKGEPLDNNDYLDSAIVCRVREKTSVARASKSMVCPSLSTLTLDAVLAHPHFLLTNRKNNT
jgi:hypothetical protein